MQLNALRNCGPGVYSMMASRTEELAELNQVDDYLSYLWKRWYHLCIVSPLGHPYTVNPLCRLCTVNPLYRRWIVDPLSRLYTINSLCHLWIIDPLCRLCTLNSVYRRWIVDPLSHLVTTRLSRPTCSLDIETKL